MNQANNLDSSEIYKFSKQANAWWDLNGPAQPLHIINPVRLDFVRQQVNLDNKTVLDVGCGAGIFSEVMAKSGAKVTGLDASQEMIDVAVEHAATESLAIEYRQSTAENFASYNRTFDIITCMELIEHVPSPSSLLAACSKMLNPSGKLFISTINRTPQAFALAIVGAEYIMKILPKKTHQYSKFIKPSEISDSLSENDLHISAISGIKYNPIMKNANLASDVKVNYILMAEKYAA